MAASERIEDRVLALVANVVRGDGGQGRALGGEYASLQLRQIVPGGGVN